MIWQKSFEEKKKFEKKKKWRLFTKKKKNADFKLRHLFDILICSIYIDSRDPIQLFQEQE